MAAPTAALGRIPARAPRAEAALFASVYERHHQALYRYCRSILRHEEDAQDALQSAMMRAFAALQTERRELELRPWLFRIAHNEAVSILRRRSATCTLDEQLGDVGVLEDRVFEREALRVLRADLAELTERQREALVLRELNGLAHEEIAAVLDTSPAAVKQAIFEARSALLRCREGRDTACGEIRRMLSDGDGRVLRGRRIRAHLQTCSGCRAFREELGHRPRELAALAPPLPAGAAAGLLRWVVGGGGSAGAVTAGSVGGGGVAAGLAAKAAVAVVLAGGAVALHGERRAPVRHFGPLQTSPAVSAGQAGRGTTHLTTTHTTSSRATAPARTHTAPPHALRDSAASTPPREAATTRTPTHARAPGQVRGAADHATAADETRGGPGRDTAPGQTRGGPGRDTAPGQTRTGTGHDTAPGQTRTGTGRATAPGQTRKETTGGAQTAPGQIRKATTGTPPPGRATAPGQIRKATTGTTSPGRATAPGQIRKAAADTTTATPHGQTAPPGQTRKAATTATQPGQTTAPGQANATAAGTTASTAPGQTGTPVAGATAPGQAAQPPGQVRKENAASPAPASTPPAASGGVSATSPAHGT